MALNDRINHDGKIVHHSAPGFYSVGRDDQCVYENCRGYRISGSRHCFQHAR